MHLTEINKTHRIYHIKLKIPRNDKETDREFYDKIVENLDMLKDSVRKNILGE